MKPRRDRDIGNARSPPLVACGKKRLPRTGGATRSTMVRSGGTTAIVCSQEMGLNPMPRPSTYSVLRNEDYHKRREREREYGTAEGKGKRISLPHTERLLAEADDTALAVVIVRARLHSRTSHLDHHTVVVVSERSDFLWLSDRPKM